MRSFTIDEDFAGKRIGAVIKAKFPDMPVSALYKAFRKRDIRVNGQRIKDEYEVRIGERVDVYITDNILSAVPLRATSGKIRTFSVAYEDNNIIVVNKIQGVPVHPDSNQSSGTLIEQVRAYLVEKGEFSTLNPSTHPPATAPAHTPAFVPALCHRLDRNTGGLVIIAKNRPTLDIILDKIKKKEIRKLYQCLVVGKMEKNADELKAYLDKDENKSRVYIHEFRKKGLSLIVTQYRVISYDKETDISKLEVVLVTGRTHQIRAHLAYEGHPLVGDGKYGENKFNRSIGAKYQALWAYKIQFDFKTDAGMLNYLKGMSLEVAPDFKPLKSSPGIL